MLRDDRGAVTAEFALAIPAVLVILGVMLGGIYLSSERVALISLAGEVARLEARGDDALAAARIASATRQPTITRESDGRVLCVTATAAPRQGIFSVLNISGRGCAAALSTSG